ncbi:MAG: AMIN domain-containing protein [Terriglobales bacterium]
MGGAGRFRTGLAAAVLLAVPLAAQNPAQVRHVSVTGSGDQIEVEIQTSGTVTPQSQLIAAPDRIVVDFPGALPSGTLHALKVNQGVLKGIRTGLFSANPPVTRVVLDLRAPRSYQILANGNVAVVKLGAASATAGAAGLAQPPAAPVPPPKPALDVTFQDGLLRIRAEKATLAEVLFEVHQQTGAEIGIPAGAEQEAVAVDLGPAPARDVLASLLNGSRYNFVFVGRAGDRSLQQVILSVR